MGISPFKLSWIGLALSIHPLIRIYLNFHISPILNKKTYN